MWTNSFVRVRDFTPLHLAFCEELRSLPVWKVHTLTGDRKGA